MTTNTEEIRKLVARLAKPNIYWKDGYAKVKRHLVKDGNIYRDDKLFIAGCSNVLAVVTPGILNADGVSSKLVSLTSGLSQTEYAGGYLYEAACILQPTELVAAMRNIQAFKVYEANWQDMLAAALLRQKSTNTVEGRGT
jgi:hypothetical protein